MTFEGYMMTLTVILATTGTIFGVALAIAAIKEFFF